MSEFENTHAKGALQFFDWERCLDNASIEPKQARSFSITIRWFLSFCRRCRVSVDQQSADGFIAWAESEKKAEDWQVSGWRLALQWFFETGQLHQKSGRPSFPSGAGTHAAVSPADRNADIRPPGDAASKPPPRSQSFSISGAWRDELQRCLRVRHMSPRTEEAYSAWAERFMTWSGEISPTCLAGSDIHDFLEDLAQEGRVSSSTQRQALNALVFFLREVYGQSLGDFSGYRRARIRSNLPTVLTRHEIDSLFASLEGTPLLMAQVMYGTGMRLTELICLRVQDVDFARQSHRRPSWQGR